jgi:hypothetical protein
MPKQLGTDLKWRIVYLHNEGRISRYLYISVPMVGKVLRFSTRGAALRSRIKEAAVDDSVLVICR